MTIFTKGLFQIVSTSVGDTEELVVPVLLLVPLIGPRAADQPIVCVAAADLRSVRRDRKQTGGLFGSSPSEYSSAPPALRRLQSVGSLFRRFDFRGATRGEPQTLRATAGEGRPPFIGVATSRVPSEATESSRRGMTSC